MANGFPGTRGRQKILRWTDDFVNEVSDRYIETLLKRYRAKSSSGRIYTNVPERI